MAIKILSKVSAFFQELVLKNTRMTTGRSYEVGIYVISPQAELRTKSLKTASTRHRPNLLHRMQIDRAYTATNSFRSSYSHPSPESQVLIQCQTLLTVYAFIRRIYTSRQLFCTCNTHFSPVRSRPLDPPIYTLQAIQTHRSVCHCTHNIPNIWVLLWLCQKYSVVKYIITIKVLLRFIQNH